MNIYIVWSFILFFTLCCMLGGCTPKEARRILVIHSYEDGYVAYPEFNKLIAEQFAEKGVNADIRTLYLDCESYLEEAELKRMFNLLDSISHDWLPEIILVNEDQATYSLLKCGHPLAKRVPVVFAGVNYPNEPLLEQYSNVTGFQDRLDILANVNVAKELFGDTTWLFTILDSTFLDMRIRNDAAEQFKGTKILGFINDLMPSKSFKMKDLRGSGCTGFISIGIRTSNNSGGLQWVLSKYFKSQCYIQLKRDHTTVNIGNICVSPSLTAINEGFGYGEKLLGGYFTTLEIQVEEAVNVAVRVLGGTALSDIPIADSRKEYVVDWLVMEQMEIPLSQIPGNYKIIHIPLREAYPVLWFVLTSVFVLFISALILGLFLLYRKEQKRRRQALSALTDEKQTLALAVEGGNTYIWKFEDGFFIFEKVFWDSLGMPSRNFLFDELLSIIHPDDRELMRKNWEQNKIDKRIVQMRCNFNGHEYQWWEFRYSTFCLAAEIYKTTGILLNIQAVKDREQELEAARLLAEKAELKQSFLANMSHEIRTPLNAIVGFSNILVAEEKLAPEDRQAYVEIINRNSELLLKLINDVLELSRLEAGAMSFKCEKYFISDLIDNIYATHQMLIPRNLTFLKEKAGEQMEIYVDIDRLTQVISNFLNNAAKFTEKGYIKLGYYYLADQKQVCIYVEDTGQGIPPEEQKMIFGRFYKQDEFSQGTGLGLSICKVIIQKLGGEIELLSEPGKGSCFRILLSCRVIDE